MLPKVSFGDRSVLLRVSKTIQVIGDRTVFLRTEVTCFLKPGEKCPFMTVLMTGVSFSLNSTRELCKLKLKIIILSFFFLRFSLTILSALKVLVKIFKSYFLNFY